MIASCLHHIQKSAPAALRTTLTTLTILTILLTTLTTLTTATTLTTTSSAWRECYDRMNKGTTQNVFIDCFSAAKQRYPNSSYSPDLPPSPDTRSNTTEIEQWCDTGYLYTYCVNNASCVRCDRAQSLDFLVWLDSRLDEMLAYCRNHTQHEAICQDKFRNHTTVTPSENSTQFPSTMIGTTCKNNTSRVPSWIDRSSSSSTTSKPAIGTVGWIVISIFIVGMLIMICVCCCCCGEYDQSPPPPPPPPPPHSTRPFPPPPKCSKPSKLPSKVPSKQAAAPAKQQPPSQQPPAQQAQLATTKSKTQTLSSKSDGNVDYTATNSAAKIDKLSDDDRLRTSSSGNLPEICNAQSSKSSLNAQSSKNSLGMQSEPMLSAKSFPMINSVTASVFSKSNSGSNVASSVMSSQLSKIKTKSASGMKKSSKK